MAFNSLLARQCRFDSHCLLDQLRPLSRASRVPVSFRPEHVGRQRHFASLRERDRRDREKIEQARLTAAAGALSVPSVSALVAGILAGGWYAGWFEGTEKKEDQFVRKLREDGIKVVVFEIFGVMNTSAPEGYVPQHELPDYLEAAALDFLPIARKLAHHGFKLAVASNIEEDLVKNKLGKHSDKYLIGTELGKVLINKRVPEAASATQVYIGFDPKANKAPEHEAGKRYHIRQIAGRYGVKPKEVLLFDICPENLLNEEGWQGVLVRDRKVGLQLDDYLDVVNGAAALRAA
mmetsp:Transcript_84983/g.177615  ORF Transcript_84983/g.177615 Transcript_84983/m.177615 type:complete len:292 (+) Transcript_84983:53-928(+)|eukprot:CAMPEP_0206559528 /NCGR_PEP_ID=MMETSP0325_2-20121206/20450_1 /ASSEMBLY_ACC=CAM_ASM_000347 /TAXON_ID=2866 /ORGANISM="Crypthecodinium cohnii, Strain Seligo" /LENGTH=291 /DNA_ID=CAMNT_0054061051 /DNA_START=53 /DNA_END=925 /DNA_ORIENTATION=+